MCSHREAAYADLPPRHELTRSERAQDRCILLPLFATLNRTELASVAQALREACLP
jgi:dTDP-4-amino-4,6-dideoxygalactose transaminase